MATCEKCGSTEYLQSHHISYIPEVLQTLCVNCHIAVHNHGTGNPKNPTRKSTEHLGIRLPRNLKKLLSEYIILDTHMNESEFVRQAIREKLERDAPQLRQLLLKKGEE